VRHWADAPQTSARPARRDQNPEIASLEEKLRTALGTKVELRRGAKGRGRLVVHFYSDEELESLLRRLEVPLE
jgi:ParB family chromosome partitioning protein